MLGVLSSIISGMAMSIQGVFNTRLGEKIGLFETNTIVQGTAFIITLILYVCFGKGNMSNIKLCKKIYLLGGVLGVIITFTVMYGIKLLGPTHSITLILVSQLITAVIIDYLGLFDSKHIHFNLRQLVGILMLISGIIILKWKS
ncbi:DMT family transporter [Clostridium sp. cel8]|uniref:DMT family transporter n=1 Tax=unclassified Clostridium TaxID=2614128 RepID=UPI0015F454F7|nr:DMT family transporter [Clostridium sp. cel8]MBA5851703.1 DMT family transporter [Clostridium sp. cel8]